MVGDVVATTHRFQLIHHRLPEVVALSGHSRYGIILSDDGVFLYHFHVLFYLLFHLRILRFLCGNRTLALCFQRCLRGRQTSLVVAGTVFHVAVNVVLRFGKSDFLYEGNCLLEIAQLHVEQLVVFLNLAATRLQLAYRLCTLHLHGVERSRNRTIVTQIGGIHMPSWVNGS